MSAKEPCPICQDPIDKTARTVTVNGIAYDVCCEECAHQARANPSLLKSARRA
jgi:YHS domain-containing protein